MHRAGLSWRAGGWLFEAHAQAEEAQREFAQRPDAPSIMAYGLTDWIIRGDGLIEKNGQLFLNNDVFAYYISSYMQQFGDLPPPWRVGLDVETQAVETQRPCVSVTHPNIIFGHALLEMLPRAYTAWRIAAQIPDLAIALSRDTPKWLIAMIHLFFDEEDIIWYDRWTQHVVSPKVFATSMLSQTYNFHPMMGDLADHLLGRYAEREAPRRRIYISRLRLGNKGWHSLANEADMEAYLSSIGFDIVHPELLPFEQQITLFSSAEVIVGEFGSGLHNALFSPAGTKVAAINRISWVQDRIAQLRDHGIGYVVPDSGAFLDWRTPNDRLNEFTVGQKRFETWLTRFLDEPRETDPPPAHTTRSVPGGDSRVLQASRNMQS